MSEKAMAGKETKASDRGVDRQAAPGSLLRDERLRRDLTIDQVAQRLHLNRATIDSLEQNDFDALPPMTFVRGYVRAYSQLLELDADAVVASLSDAGAKADSEPLYGWVGGASAPPPGKPSRLREAKMLVAIAVTLVIVIAAVGGGAWWFTQQSESAPALAEPEVDERTKEPTEEPVNEPTESQDPEPQVPEQRTDSPEPTEAVPSSALASDSELAGTAAAAAASDADEEVIPSDAPVVTQPEPQATREPRADDASLALVFTGESWMEISDANGDRLLFGLQSEGEEQLWGQPPFEVVVGDVNSVVVEFEGESVDLDAYARGNVARFTLGES
ncbi:RodZ domain-containing protein [Spiribacter salinus]|nr:RodZ domain-containing protein [Spiribacter salinus]